MYRIRCNEWHTLLSLMFGYLGSVHLWGEALVWCRLLDCMGSMSASKMQFASTSYSWGNSVRYLFTSESGVAPSEVLPNRVYRRVGISSHRKKYWCRLDPQPDVLNVKGIFCPYFPHVWSDCDWWGLIFQRYQFLLSAKLGHWPMLSKLRNNV